MYNLLLSLAAGVAVALAIAFGTSYGWVAAIFPSIGRGRSTVPTIAPRARMRTERSSVAFGPPIVPTTTTRPPGASAARFSAA